MDKNNQIIFRYWHFQGKLAGLSLHDPNFNTLSRFMTATRHTTLRRLFIYFIICYLLLLYFPETRWPLKGVGRQRRPLHVHCHLRSHLNKSSSRVPKLGFYPAWTEVKLLLKMVTAQCLAEWCQMMNDLPSFLNEGWSTHSIITLYFKNMPVPP